MLLSILSVVFLVGFVIDLITIEDGNVIAMPWGMVNHGWYVEKKTFVGVLVMGFIVMSRIGVGFIIGYWIAGLTGGKIF
jgi:hypothetical protein